jgi:hypothetical protein
MGIAHKGSTMQEKVGTLMATNGIKPPDSKFEYQIGSGAVIETLEQAVQWLYQKMRTRDRYDKASYGAIAVATTAGGFVGAAGTPAGIVIGAGVGAAGAWGLGKIGRGIKAVAKTVAGTKGKHREQAAGVLVRHALDYKMGVSDNPIAYQLLQLYYDQPVLDVLLQASEGRQAWVAAEVAKVLHS